MLVEAAPDRKIQVLSRDSTSPAAQVTSGKVYSSLADCLRESQTVIFENEFVDVAELRKLNAGERARFVPTLEVIGKLQDKLEQKRALEAARIPCARYLAQAGMGLAEFLAKASARLGPELILKWARLGYDGKGVFFHSPGREAEARAFAAAAQAAGVELFAEARIAFTRELAMTSARGQGGETVHYPAVETRQSRGICHVVVGPARELGLSAEREREIAQWMARLADQLGLEGAFAFELFETDEGVLVNEIAPRVHNSSHYTQDAADVSQFALHLQAAEGRKLAPPRCQPFFGMLNLLGPAGVELAAAPPAITSEWQAQLAARGFRLHWYGKAGVRPGRKLGHVNFVAADRADFERKRQMLPQIENEFRALLGPG